MRLVLLLSMFVVFASCEKEPKPEIQKPKETVWNNTHRYISGMIDVFYDDEGELQAEEREIDVDVPESEAYVLTLGENGTGRGSAAHNDGSGRFNFNVLWNMSDDTLTIRCPAEVELCATSPDYEFSSEYGIWYDSDVVWKIEECTADRMVLSMEGWMHYDGDDFGWNEHRLFRYTFEKVK